MNQLSRFLLGFPQSLQQPSYKRNERSLAAGYWVEGSVLFNFFTGFLKDFLHTTFLYLIIYKKKKVEFFKVSHINSNASREGTCYMAGPKNTSGAEGRILLFPGVRVERQASSPGEPCVAPSKHNLTEHLQVLSSFGRDPIKVVLCGTFRVDTEDLSQAFEQLKNLGCRILSSARPEADDFVSMCSEAIETHERLKLKHLDAIREACFVWLHAPKGYVGPTAAFEIGFALANGVPIFSSAMPNDIVLQKLVRVVTSPHEVLDILNNPLELPSADSAAQFQH